MDAYNSITKIRKSGSGNNIVSHLNTYQGELIRNSGGFNLNKVL